MRAPSTRRLGGNVVGFWRRVMAPFREIYQQPEIRPGGREGGRDLARIELAWHPTADLAARLLRLGGKIEGRKAMRGIKSALRSSVSRPSPSPAPESGNWKLRYRSGWGPAVVISRDKSEIYEMAAARPRPPDPSVLRNGLDMQSGRTEIRFKTCSLLATGVVLTVVKNLTELARGRK